MAASPTPANDGIMQIAPYVGGDSAINGANRTIKLSSNEGALGPSPAAMAAYKDAANSLHRYPDGGATALRNALAELHGLDADRIVCGAGSDEILSLLCQAYAGPGDGVIHSAHGFLMYAISARAVGANPVSVPESGLTTDVDAILDAVNDKTKLVFIANPNNPTGTHLNGQQLRRLHDGLPTEVLLIIDGAYAEFVDREDYEDGAAMVDRADNVVMTRTFSKIYGLGGLRLGWGYMPDAVADVINRVRGPFSVSAAALAAGLAAVEDQTFVTRAREENLANRTWTERELRDLGYELTDSLGNFVLMRVPDAEGAAFGSGADACDTHLKANGIIVRRMGGYGLPDRLRVTIGTADEMAAFVEALKTFEGGPVS